MREFDYPGTRFVPREYQLPIMGFFDKCLEKAIPGRAWWCMHRRGGKDRTMLVQACKMSQTRIGTYWHLLPSLKQARKAVWDNITPEGKNLIDTTFPREMIRKKNELEMKLTLHNGSIVQLLGADNFDSNVGASPVHATFSEYALSHPRGWHLVRPILTENNGTAAFISTPRGYNDFHALGEVAKLEQFSGRWYYGMMDINYTMTRGGRMTPEKVAQEIRDGMPEELVRQEYYCDFSAANVGAILGKWIEQADRDNRIYDFVTDGQIELSADIGFHDTAAFWAWQRLPNAWFAACGYDEGSGRDAEDWIEHFDKSGWSPDKVSMLWLPHDARAKTFATKTSAQERFKAAGYRVEIVPMLSVADRISAARKVARRTIFHRTACELGLKALRAWQFKYNEETRQFGANPDHNWASHGGDGYSYGAIVMNPRAIQPPPPPPPVAPPVTHNKVYTLDDLWETAPGGMQ